MRIENDIADAIESFLTVQLRVMKRSIEQGKSILVAEHCGQDWTKYEGGQYSVLNKISTFDLMKCLVNGYEII